MVVTVKTVSPRGAATIRAAAGASSADASSAPDQQQPAVDDDDSTLSSIATASDFTYSAPPSEVSEYDGDLRSVPGRAERDARRRGREEPSRTEQECASSLSGSPCEDEGSKRDGHGEDVGGEKREVSATNEFREPGGRRGRSG